MYHLPGHNQPHIESYLVIHTPQPLTVPQNARVAFSVTIFQHWTFLSCLIFTTWFFISFFVPTPSIHATASKNASSFWDGVMYLSLLRLVISYILANFTKQTKPI